jgi:hypothetical protein
MSEQRKPGYYWVRRWGSNSNIGPWEIAEWKRSWWMIGYSTPMSDVEMWCIGQSVDCPHAPALATTPTQPHQGRGDVT